jgi:hypothetical protein
VHPVSSGYSPRNFRRLFVLALPLGLVGCYASLNNAKEFRYEVSVQIGAESLVLAGNYTCVLRGQGLSERGPLWFPTAGRGLVQVGSDVVIVGRSATGVAIQARPKGIVTADQYCDAFSPGGPARTLDSRVFFRAAGADTYSSVDSGEIRVASSSFTLLQSGFTPAPRGVVGPEAPTQQWYSVSAQARSIDAIEKDYSDLYGHGAGLRSFITSTQRLWLGKNSVLPFDEAARADLSASFKFREQLWPYGPHRQSGNLAMRHSGTSGWRPNALQEWMPVPAASLEMPNLGVGGTSLQGVGTDWIEYGGSRIEFPLAHLAYRYVYDQSKDQIVVFRIEVVPLVAQ